MTKLFVNGKFLAQRTTGVQRFAFGVLTALDKNLQEFPTEHEIEILLPPNAVAICGLSVIRQRHVGRANLSLTWWEQVELPFHARKGVLMCLSGSAPLFSRKCIPTIHDAAIYLYPEAYRFLFVKWYRLLFKVLTWTAPMILTVSTSTARELKAHLRNGIFKVVHNAAEHILSIPPDNSILNKFDLEPKRYLLAVGSQNLTKNIDALIRAYLSLRLSKDILLVIVGGSNSDVFSTKCRSQNSESGVIFTGIISDESLRALYENALVFVFPSVYEGFGIPAVEAMVCGCPVIASKAAAITEVCGDAVIYFDPLSASNMSEVIGEFLENSVARNSLINRGLKRAGNFTWRKSAIALRGHLNDAGLLGVIAK